VLSIPIVAGVMQALKAGEPDPRQAFLADHNVRNSVQTNVAHAEELDASR
jgi:hypothetical protein